MTVELATRAAEAVPSIWLVWASQGEYSDRSEWPVLATLNEATAQVLVERLTGLWRSIDAKWRRIEPEWWDQAALDTFWATDPEAVAYSAITGLSGENLGGCYTDERSYTCCEVNVWSAPPPPPPAMIEAAQQEGGDE